MGSEPKSNTHNPACEARRGEAEGSASVRLDVAVSIIRQPAAGRKQTFSPPAHDNAGQRNITSTEVNISFLMSHPSEMKFHFFYHKNNNDNNNNKKKNSHKHTKRQL